MSESLTPLVVASSGRSGTTAFMQMLGSSCRVAFDRIYAYENAYLSYFMQLSDVPENGAIELPGPGGRGLWRRAALDEASFVPRHGFVGGLPWQRREILDRVGGTVGDELLVAMWEVFSRHARGYAEERCEDRSSPVLFYAETAPVWVADRSRDVLGGRTIYLARDPRDQWVSIIAFNEKLDAPSFGYQPDDTHESFTVAFIERQRRFLQRVAGTTETSTELVVHFEELVAQPDSLAHRLSDWLAVEITSEFEQDHAPGHGTSKPGRGPLGRWREEMPDHVLAMFEVGLRDEIEGLGWSWD